MKFTKIAAAAIGASMMAGGVSAATCTTENNGGQLIIYTATQGSPDHIQESFCTSGNDTNTILSSYELFTLAGWALGDKTEGNDGDDEVYFATFEYADDNDNGVLDWEILNPSGYSYVALTLKQSSSFAAFLLDTTKALSGSWSISGPGDDVDNISHGSAYYNGEPNVIPLPAAGWLLLAGIGGLAALRRRKSV